MVDNDFNPVVELQAEVEANPTLEIQAEVEANPTLEIQAQVEMGGVASEYNAEAWAVGERHGVPVSSTDQTYENNSKYYAETVAQGKVEDAEAWAVGQRGGTDVPSTDPAYENSAKYWAEQAAAIVAGDIIDDTAGIGDLLKVWSADKDVKELDKKAPVIEGSRGTEAAVQEIGDAADGMPMKVVAGIEPVQDLHGYDFPWVGGAGKNVCPAMVEFLKSSNTTGASWSGNVCTKGNVTYSVQTDNAGNVVGIVANGSDTSNQAFAVGSVSVPFNLSAGEYVVTGCPASGSTTTYRITVTDAAFNVFARDTGSGASFTLTEQTGIIIFCDIRANYSASDITFKPMIRLASVTDDTFEPYENICPISGWTGAKITRTGKNLLGGTALRDALLTAIPSASHDATNKVVHFTASSAYDKKIVSREYKEGYAVRLPFKENTQYSFIFTGYNSNTTTGTTNINIYYTDGTSDNPWFNSTAAEKSTRVFVSDAGKTIAYITGTYNKGTSYFYYEECGIFEGVLTAADFEPYQGNTYNISFPAGTGTVYGGTLTVNKDGSGELVVDRVSYALDELEFTYSSSRWGTEAISGIATPANNNQVLSGMMCSAFRARTANQVSSVVGSIAVSNNAKILLNVNGTNDTTAFDNAVDGQIIVIPLATAVSYSLTPGQVKSLLGYNALWADTGNIKSVDYCADTKAYIDALFSSILPATGVSF